MGANRHARRSPRHRTVELPYISQMLAFTVAALLGNVFALFRIIQIGQTGVVELQIRTTQVSQRPQLSGVHFAEIVPEFLEVWVDRGIDRSAATAIMHHAG